jgi:hypothetical protein
MENMPPEWFEDPPNADKGEQSQHKSLKAPVPKAYLQRSLVPSNATLPTTGECGDDELLNQLKKAGLEIPPQERTKEQR